VIVILVDFETRPASRFSIEIGHLNQTDGVQIHRITIDPNGPTKQTTKILDISGKKWMNNLGKKVKSKLYIPALRGKNVPLQFIIKKVFHCVAVKCLIWPNIPIQIVPFSMQTF
jgi:hypothetical protein